MSADRTIIVCPWLGCRTPESLDGALALYERLVDDR